MSSVTVRSVVASFTAAQIACAGIRLMNEGIRLEAGALVRTVTEWLVLGLAACTEVVCLSLL